MSAAKPSGTAPDERVPIVCGDGHRRFLALGEWQIRCWSCYHAWKASGEAPASAAEVERLRAENTALREELAQAQNEVARWRRIAQTAPRKRAARTPPRKAPIPADQWRWIVPCGPPDRHGGRVSAVEATRGLLEHRP